MPTRLTSFILWALLAMCSCASAPGETGPGETGEERARCPEGREADEQFCSQIPRYARDADTGQCCRYSSPCATPAGWKTYPTESACEAATDD